MPSTPSRHGKATGFALLGACLGLAVACEEDVAAAGEACDIAQDCDGSLVCARVSEDASDKVCADLADTREDLDCVPEYAGMTCSPVLRDAPPPDSPDGGTDAG